MVSVTVEAAIRGSAPAAQITFVQTPHSTAWYDNLTQTISSDDDALKAAGVHLIEWGDADLSTGRLIVQVLDLTPAKTALLEARYGPGNLLLQDGAALPVLTAGPPRANDTPPWNGGDFITNRIHDCTSGFGAHSALGLQFMITAGHCFPVLSLVRNGSFTQSPPLGPQFGSFRLMGPVTSNARATTRSLDAEIFSTALTGGSSNLIFAGNGNSAERDAVSGVISTPRGVQVCQSGAFEPECGLLVTNSRPICINTTSGLACHIHRANATGGPIAVGQGDSGGPVYRFVGSQVFATGIVTAEKDPTFLCPTLNLQGNRRCSKTLYYTAIQPILKHFGLALN